MALGPLQKQAFEEANTRLTSTKILTHSDLREKLVLSCDASPYGLGAVLSHRFPDGTKRSIAYASCPLAVAEKKYAQIKKKRLATVTY